MQTFREAVPWEPSAGQAPLKGSKRWKMGGIESLQPIVTQATIEQDGRSPGLSAKLSKISNAYLFHLMDRQPS